MTLSLGMTALPAALLFAASAPGAQQVAGQEVKPRLCNPVPRDQAQPSQGPQRDPAAAPGDLVCGTLVPAGPAKPEAEAGPVTAADMPALPWGLRSRQGMPLSER